MRAEDKMKNLTYDKINKIKADMQSEIHNKIADIVNRCYEEYGITPSEISVNILKQVTFGPPVRNIVGDILVSFDVFENYELFR